MTIYPRSFKSPLRQALIDYAHQVNGKHHLTLNFHAHYRPDHATECLRRWYSIVMRRLFGRSWNELPKESVIEFVMFPEYSLATPIHFHGPIRIPESHLEYFMKIATLRWKTIVPTGSLHFTPIGQTQQDYDKLFDYITKSSTASDLVHSSMLYPNLPAGTSTEKTSH